LAGIDVPTPPVPIPPGACLTITYWVRAGAAEGIGTRARPFAHIGDALAAAGRVRWICGVRVEIADGVYGEDLVISGSSVKVGPHDFAVMR
jgi:hypothetical protein